MSDNLKELKAKADKLGLDYPKNAGEEKMQEILDMYQLEQEAENEEAPKSDEPLTDAELRRYKQKKVAEAKKLVRIRVTCHDPSKKEWPGEWIGFDNSVIGTIRRYVPYNSKPTHVEQAILNVLQKKEFQKIKTTKSSNPLGGEITRRYNVKALAIEVLPPLTEEELKALADEQKATGRLEDDEKTAG